MYGTQKLHIYRHSMLRRHSNSLDSSALVRVPKGSLAKRNQFVLVSLSSGFLAADIFATLLPERMHSQPLIDTETVDSF